MLSAACLTSRGNSEDEAMDPEPSAAAAVPEWGEGGADSFHTSPCTNTFLGSNPWHICLSPPPTVSLPRRLAVLAGGLGGAARLVTSSCDR